MRHAIAIIALVAALGLAFGAQAQCEACAKGFTFWHSKDACLADDGSGAMTAPLYWKKDRMNAAAEVPGMKLAGRTGGAAGPTGDR
ncbi:MAG TPA: hypothetical protein VMY41_04600 [Thermohalobaculum sp.]|nr:hypothetical protein [Thermohalobaculum sp.]